MDLPLLNRHGAMDAKIAKVQRIATRLSAVGWIS
jgi:hypothetical protein